ncbi:MAG: hypothetical protein AMXMBFR33_01900 [Candidatus Xenobia bacterium]
MRGRSFLAVLERAPLCYEVERQKGSHMLMKSAAGYPDLLFAFHGNANIPGGLVKRILVGHIGLSEEEALGLL